jgi:thiol-disulfide isomerase/thioredoxin
MRKVDSIEEAISFIKENSLALIYISSEDCSVCKVLMPKIEELLSKYEKIQSIKIDISEIPAVSGQFSVFTIPTIIFFINGEEYIRESRFISILDLDGNIERYYNMLFR